MSAYPETCLPLSGLEEASLYHDAGNYGFFFLLWHENASVGSKWPLPGSQNRLKEKCYLLREMPRIVENLDSTPDTWISQAEFVSHKRRVVYLLRISLCFVDLDTYKAAWKGCNPEVMVNLLLGFCQDEDIPEPSLILFS